MYILSCHMSHCSKIHKFRPYPYLYLESSLSHLTAHMKKSNQIVFCLSSAKKKKKIRATWKMHAKAVRMIKTRPSRAELVSRDETRRLLVWWRRKMLAIKRYMFFFFFISSSCMFWTSSGTSVQLLDTSIYDMSLVVFFLSFFLSLLILNIWDLDEVTKPGIC